MSRCTLVKMAGVFCVAILGSAIAGRAQEAYDSSKVATIEVEVRVGDDPAVVASGGPWEWSVGIWVIDGIPATDVGVLRVVLRDANGGGVYWGELEGLSVSAGFFGPGVIFLTPDPAGISVLDPPINFLGIVPLQPFSLDVALDIKPGSARNPFNPKSRGKLPVVILGSDEVDVRDINVDSLQLAGCTPVRSKVEDACTLNLSEGEDEISLEGPDGYDDLVLWFSSRDLAEVVGEAENGAELPLLLTGELVDGTAIEGLDLITIVGDNGRKDPEGDKEKKEHKPEKSCNKKSK